MRLPSQASSPPVTQPPKTCHPNNAPLSLHFTSPRHSHHHYHRFPLLVYCSTLFLYIIAHDTYTKRDTTTVYGA
ncbi:hypothetical protein Pmani_036294 [Petrolisthes manimaculis]|uniref:Uncharacterized protein n=1 Tax=Petrolisthes manimaculis TaxID=1843537 RepID=A0AAE1NJY2_9EUCA|nr:hypothetical protein Pmani_036294 [Petrolisthes manimaculis]